METKSLSLIPPGVGRTHLGGGWYECRDGDPDARELFHRHYSRYIYRDGREPKKFVGPGEYLCLITFHGDALFAWRKFISADGQRGVNCAIFRNEGTTPSSLLIIAAEAIAWRRWPGERLYTYVNPNKIRSTNPGWCFQVCGWRKCGVTKARGLVILEKIPRHELIRCMIESEKGTT